MEEFFQGEFPPFQFTERFIGNKNIFKVFDFFDCSQTAEIAVRIVGHDQIDLSGLKQFHTFDGSLVGHLDMCVWKFLVEALQIRDKKIAADRITGADADLSSGCGRIHQLGFSALDQIHCWFYMAQQDLTFRGELDSFGTPDEKGLIQLFFQSFDRLAHCRLGDKELLGSF